MSTKRQRRERKREEVRGGGPSLLRRSREFGGRRFGYPVLIVVAVAFVLWLVIDLIWVR